MGAQLDPCNVQCGAAGVGEFLVSALPFVDVAEPVIRSIAHLSRWILDDVRRPVIRPQGLYFGSAGAAWFLLDASAALKDDELREEACRLARSLTPLPGRVDVTHGSSGIGMTLLHFYHATGRAEFLDAALELAHGIAAVSEQRGGETVWPQRHGTNTGPTAFYGFAHGNAGIAYFLLGAYAASRTTSLLAAGLGAVETLTRAAVIEDDCAYWPHGPDNPTRWTYWCNGCSGVGTTLIRVYRITGDPSYGRLARLAANAVHRHRWYSLLGYCHGLAGDGEFLLDLHQALGEDDHRRMANDLAEVLFTRRICREGRTLFADDSGTSVSADFAVGTSGIGAFFHRLVVPRRRLFMTDELFDGL